MITRRNILTAALLALPLASCSKESASGSAPSANGNVTLNGAGATFPYPLYSKWMSEYNAKNPNIRINYQSIGSGGGIRQITARTVDFGATDAPMTEDEVKKAPAKLIHIPTTMGAVVVTYNLEGVSAPLKLVPDVLADMYLGKISKWNDPRVVADNPGVTLPDKNISVVYRSDGSGTTAVFTEYLAKVSPTFKQDVGVGKSVKWPAGLGAKGNEGVTGQVKTTPGALGYVELAYALQNKMPTAALKNKAGEFVTASIPAITKAGAGAEMPDDLYVSITDSAGAGAYPISAYTYLLVYEDGADAVKSKALAEFLWWAIHDGQSHAEALHYAPLPDPVMKKVEARLKTLKAGGKALLSGS
ncbi:MAG: phosphate ABC transporter substrate-binding protein PstS [Polyangiaceae bacterium]